MERFRPPWKKENRPSSFQNPALAQLPPGPPPVPYHSRPGGSSSSSPQPLLPDKLLPRTAEHSHNYPAGAIYAPGQWPTPELSVYPLGAWRLLSDPEHGWTGQSIQAALDAIGEGGTIYLPRGSKWELDEGLKLQAYQEIATDGYPTDEKEMAALDATENLRLHIITAWNMTGIRIRNLVVDGKHDVYGREDGCQVMIQLGGWGANCRDQWCDRCIIRNPRQWSCIQAFTGTVNVRITNCRIGPAGVGKDIREGHWADGISFPGEHGLVAGNEIIDATDGAIVVCQATGTLVTSNTIVCYSRLLLGGINMVDHVAPNPSDYTQTRVVHNTILTAGHYIMTGIAQGPSAWGAGPGEPSPDKVLKNAIVARNLIHYQDRGRGKGSIGYGFPISGDVVNWTCVENVSADEVVYEGDMSDADWQGNGGLSAAPGPFVRAAGPVAKLGKLQDECVPGLVRGLLAIKPGRSSVLRLFPGQLRLRPGGTIPLKQWVFEFCHDGDVVMRNSETGEICWSSRSKGCISGQEEVALLELSPSGHLRIADVTNPQHVFFNLTPLLPPTGIPGCDSESTTLPTLRISDNEPHMQLLTPDGNGILLSSSYEAGWNRMCPVGSYVCRASVDGETTIVSTMSPYGQYMVLSTKQGTEVNLPITWPLDVSKWFVLWQTPNNPLPEKTDGLLYFQGDGNLVAYADGKPQWNSATYGPPDKAAKFLKWGDGSPQQPFLELVNEARQRVWST